MECNPKKFSGLTLALMLGGAVLLGSQLDTLTARVSLRDRIDAQSTSIHSQRPEYQRRYVEGRVQQSQSSVVGRYRTQTRVPTAVPKTVAAPMTQECLDLADLKVQVLGVISPTRNSHFSRLHTRISALFDAEYDTARCNDAPVEMSAPAPRQTGIPTLQQGGTPRAEELTPGPRPRVNNSCSQYGYLTRRYKQCVVNERAGSRYQGNYFGGQLR